MSKLRHREVKQPGLRPPAKKWRHLGKSQGCFRLVKHNVGVHYKIKFKSPAKRFAIVYRAKNATLEPGVW